MDIDYDAVSSELIQLLNEHKAEGKKLMGYEWHYSWRCVNAIQGGTLLDFWKKILLDDGFRLSGTSVIELSGFKLARHTYYHPTKYVSMIDPLSVATGYWKEANEVVLLEVDHAND